MASCDTEFRREEIIANKKEQELKIRVELIERHKEQLAKCNFVYNCSWRLVAGQRIEGSERFLNSE